MQGVRDGRPPAGCSQPASAPPPCGKRPLPEQAPPLTARTANTPALGRGAALLVATSPAAKMFGGPPSLCRYSLTARNPALSTGRPVSASQEAALACVVHRHSSNGRRRPSASTATPASTAATPPGTSNACTPRSWAGAGRGRGFVSEPRNSTDAQRRHHRCTAAVSALDQPQTRAVRPTSSSGRKARRAYGVRPCRIGPRDTKATDSGAAKPTRRRSSASLQGARDCKEVDSAV